MSHHPRAPGVLSWVIRVGLTVAVALASAGPSGPGANAASAPAATDETLLDARLGGMRASFAAAFGAPVVENVVNGSRFDVAGFGLVLVQFRQTTKEIDPGDRATVLTLRSPRPEETAATTPDRNDWTLDQAFQVVLRFLPADVALEGPATAEAADTDRQGIEQSCRSDALAGAFKGEPAAGVCQIAFLMPTAVTVSYVTLILADEDPDTSRIANSCAGMQDWGEATGARMQSALATLAEVGQIDENDPAAPAQLRDLATRFADLAAAQTAAAPPRAARKAGEQLAAAFAGFAAAMTAAATGLESDDRDALAQAVADLEAARVLFDAANALVLSVLQRCGLTG
jgi:hypothetical protein